MRSTTLFTFLLLFVAALYAGPTTKFAWHTVEKGETLYSISRQYGIKPAELASYNEMSADKMTIRIGQKLKVPASSATSNEEPATIAAAPVTADNTASGNYHIVKKGETFYSISRDYKVARTDLQMWNNLDDLNLKVGQKLIVKGATTENIAATASAPKAIAKTNPLPKVPVSNVSTATGDATASLSNNIGLASTRTIKSWKEESVALKMEDYKPKSNYDPANEYESLYYQNVYSGLAKKTETGVVKVMNDNNPDHVVYYNNASVGTILRLTNTGNGKTTYAIVVGKVPAADDNTYLVKLSDRVARNLMIKDYTSVEVVCYSAN